MQSKTIFYSENLDLTQNKKKVDSEEKEKEGHQDFA